MSRLRLYRKVIGPEMLDYNGHMTEGWYVLLFGEASDALYDHIGADAHWRRTTGKSLYTVEAHLRYLRELSEGDAITIVTQLVALDHKRLHFVHEMERDGEVAATEELLVLCVDRTLGRSSRLEPSLLKKLQALCTLPPPAYSGRSIALPARPPA
ncbi:MAG TPA: thioesterase family protein [Kiloniellales bacterium]|nr:thioesterase family protein [Kiloniellales bacterium]